MIDGDIDLLLQLSSAFGPVWDVAAKTWGIIGLMVSIPFIINTPELLKLVVFSSKPVHLKNHWCGNTKCVV